MKIQQALMDEETKIALSVVRKGADYSPAEKMAITILQNREEIPLSTEGELLLRVSAGIMKNLILRPLRSTSDSRTL